ncbi:sporulation protein, YlmC/YmxH family [Anaeromicropila populeti]|uniref:Sporulation protein, YlmC/YmxH family n=1 Tax=Anaeromicropila populeti TaxID=37658 RepID=A0A1I6KX17_9FIRM|nr:sporulation protein, YlmC/YmxH family [Anaeromicropila populeti]
MRMCELREKEVINAIDCQRLGFVCDIEFNLECGRIEKLIVPGPCKLFGIIGREYEYIIDFRCIVQIGPDVILVEIDPEKALHKCC